MEVKFTAGETVRGLDLSGTGFENTDLSGASFGCCEECEKEGKYCVKMQKSLLDSVDMAGSHKDFESGKRGQPVKDRARQGRARIFCK